MFSPFRALATTLLLLLPYNPRCKRNFRYLEGRFSALYLGSLCDELCSRLVFSFGAEVCPA
jgi:hypothetical protein